MPTITIDVSDERYSRLQEIAARQVRPLPEVAAAVVDTYTDAAAQEYEETCAAIAQGLADLEAGRHYSLEETWTYLEERQAARRGQSVESADA